LDITNTDTDVAMQSLEIVIKEGLKYEHDLSLAAARQVSLIERMDRAKEFVQVSAII